MSIAILRDLENKIKQREEVIARLNKEIDALKTVYELEEAKPTGGRTTRHNSHEAELTDAIESVLQEERPLHRRVILERVQAKGIYVGGDNAVKAMSPYLTRDNRFKNVSRGVWTLARTPSIERPPGQE